MNPSKKTEFVGVFKKVSEVKEVVEEYCENTVSDSVGYVEPGHGTKGKH